MDAIHRNPLHPSRFILPRWGRRPCNQEEVNVRPILRAEGLSKAFGRLLAVSGVNLEVAAGSIHAIIGPNGAGKSTLFDLLSGAKRPDKGRVYFLDKEITHIAVEERIRLGLSRTFQVPQVFTNLTVRENLIIALEAAHSLSSYPWPRKTRFLEEEASALLERLGLEEQASRPVGELAHGDQRLVEIGLALCLRPKLLLLDEPTAGMSDAETWRTVQTLKTLHREEGLTLLFIEHDMAVVFGIADRVTVLHLGEVLAEGTPDEIAKDEKVQAAYLGEEVMAG
uniref:ABC transporter ATP-binding protein n=1 Tax=Thermus tengchongensis TaxID=1214928 RepID=A0A7V4AL68_9DEIN